MSTLRQATRGGMAQDGEAGELRRSELPPSVPASRERQSNPRPTVDLDPNELPLRADLQIAERCRG
jgi:hypothetical protein